MFHHADKKLDKEEVSTISIANHFPSLDSLSDIQEFKETNRLVQTSTAGLVNEQQLDEHQQNWLRKYFRNAILPHITPILLTPDIDLLEFLKDESHDLAWQYAWAIQFKRSTLVGSLVFI